MRLCGIALLAVFMAACVSGPADIPDDLTVAELIQRAQEASDKNWYNQALEYYEAVIARFPANIDMICAAEYEIAFIHYKLKKYETAKAEFTSLLARYDTSDAELLPAQFKILAEKILGKITDKEKAGSPQA
jgi:outer membrane protein assembly factor BamD (BamD/ComL family)